MKKIIFLALMACCSTVMQATANGTLSGRFSVAPGLKVVFSQGNLQYNPYHDEWRFAEHQYDFVGGDKSGNVSFAFDNCSNCSVGPTYDCWIDLFGWGTGNAPVQRVEDAAQYPEFNDWGDKVIREGGLLGQRWRTLTWEEWYYLLVERPHADELRGQATVNNVHGYILLPDDWKQSNKIPFTPDPNNWTTNEYNDKQWKKMEEAGAVFLPAAGFRSDREVSTVGAFGFYWSSTVFVSDRVPQDDARDIFICEKRFGPRDHEKRYYGLSVRLVQDVF